MLVFEREVICLKVRPSRETWIRPVVVVVVVSATESCTASADR
jgi:hypothetical protein